MTIPKNRLKSNRRLNMEYSEVPYFKYSRFCLSPFGLWPNQNYKTKVGLRVATFLAVLTVLIPHIAKAYEVRHHFQLFMLCIPSLLYYTHYLIQFYHLTVRENEYVKILNQIRDDFLIYKNKHLDTLHTYSKQAQTLNAVYTYYFIFGVVTFNSTTFLPHLQDMIRPLNESRPRHVTRHVKYNIAVVDESFYFILVHGFIFDVVAVFVIIGFDTLLVSFAQHACALFQITINQLRDFANVPTVTSVGCKLDALYYRNVVNAIVSHKHAIGFVNEIEDLYWMVNVIVLGISLATITLTEFQSVSHRESLDITSRYVMYATGQLLKILYQNWPGQIVKDHSLRVHKHCYECQWYKEGMPDRIRKLLIFMMLRSQTPASLSAGKIFVLDLENYVKIFRASLSYFAVLTSIQK